MQLHAAGGAGAGGSVPVFGFWFLLLPSHHITSKRLLSQAKLSQTNYVDLINPRENPSRHLFLVFVPILAVLPLALLFVSAFPMDEQDGKIHDIKIRHQHPPPLGAPLNDIGRGRERGTLVDHVAGDAGG